MLVSIVTPVYNTESFIYECIDSVIKQTADCWELLLVDDGSTDRSGSICDYYSKQDTRIRYFHQENRGAAAARNTALENAKGDFVLMLDSDDWLEDNCIEECVSKIGNTECIDVLQFNYNYVDFQTGHSKSIFRGKRDVLCTSLNEYRSLHLPVLCAAGWFFRKSVIDRYQIRYDTCMRFHEDRIFDYNILQHAQYIKVTTLFLYNYRANINSVNHRTTNEDIVDSTIRFAQYSNTILPFRREISEQAMQYAVNLTVTKSLNTQEAVNLFSRMKMKTSDIQNKGYKLFLVLFRINKRLALRLINCYHSITATKSR